VIGSPSDFLPDGPTPLTSEPWKRDYNLTRLYGAATGSMRSAAETEIGTYWTEHTGQQYARAFNNLVNNYTLNTADSAKLMTMLWVGISDAAIGCFNAKYTYGFWRPVTAIPAGGGSSDLTADAQWTPLGATPSHPAYPAAHGCLTGAATSLIAGYFGTTKVHIATDSTAFTDGLHTHTFEDTLDLMDECRLSLRPLARGRPPTGAERGRRVVEFPLPPAPGHPGCQAAVGGFRATALMTPGDKGVRSLDPLSVKTSAAGRWLALPRVDGSSFRR
jgi:hypothetical protein